MKEAVLLLAHGAPERLEDVDAYLTQVRSGRPLSAPVVEEIRNRYAAIGGASPLAAWTRKQAEALEALLGLKVYFGMRNWKPFIRETMEQIRCDGIGRLVAICLAPQYSKMSIGLYFRKVQEARQELGMQVEILWTKSFHDHPLLIEAFAERLRPVVEGRRVLFTAHSLPEKVLETADPYDAEAHATARGVAARLGITLWDFAYQSPGMSQEKWLGPAVESVLDRYGTEGVRAVALAPIGFVCDHVEILYDVDILFRDYAARRGIDLLRPESLNGSPAFTRTLAAVARQKLQSTIMK